jgi:hypothetical protein
MSTTVQHNSSPTPQTTESINQIKKKDRRNSWITFTLRIFATVALMVFVLQQVEWESLVRRLKSLEWQWYAAAQAVAIVIQVVAGIRWSSLARPIGFVHSTSFFIWRFFEGVFFNLCLPSSIGGDVVKAYRLSSTNRGRLLAGCTILADRLAGVSALGVLAGSAILSIKLNLSPASTIAVGTVLFASVLLGFRLTIGNLDRFLDLLPATHKIRQFLSQLLPYQIRPSLMGRAVAWSLIVQVGASVSVALMARGIGVNLGLGIWFSVVPLIALAIVLPISINGVGIREGGMALLLSRWGVAGEQAVAIGLLWFLTTIGTGLIGGVLFLLDKQTSGSTPTQKALRT